MRDVPPGDRRSPRAPAPRLDPRLRQGGRCAVTPRRGHRPGRSAMNLHDLVERYIALHRALGKPFVGNACRLRGFVRVLGPDASISDVTLEHVNAFLTGEGPMTRNYHVKHSILHGFFLYARSRGYLDALPLPARTPRPPPPFQPYIYSLEELRRLVGAVATVRRRQDCALGPATVRTVLL